MMGDIAIRISDIHVTFGDHKVLKGASGLIRKGSIVTFLGRNGCGKSTLLRMIAGLEDVTSGEVALDGVRINDLPPARREIAMVFQSYALYPHMTVRENMAFGLKIAKTDNSTIDQKVNEAARILQLDKLLDRLPKELSGGQRQRVT